MSTADRMTDPACIFPSCKRVGGPRGLCANHQNTARKLIETGLTTWEKLERAGKALPKRNRSKVAEWFLSGEPAKVVSARPGAVDSRGRLPQDPTSSEIAQRAAEARSARRGGK